MIEPLVEQPQEGDVRLAHVVSDDAGVPVKGESQDREHEVNYRREGHIVQLFLDAESPAKAARHSNKIGAVRERLDGP